MHVLRTPVSIVLLIIFLMPSPRILDPERTHKRHATCAHHLRHHHPDQVEQAKILRRAERRRLQREEAERVEQARLDRARQNQSRRVAFLEVADQPPAAVDQDRPNDGALAARDLDESNLQPCQAAADPQDDDSSMKKGRRATKVKTLFWSLQEPPRIRPAGDFLVMIRLHLEPRHPSPSAEADVLPHYGSGPCHFIPRPREGTTTAAGSCLPVAA